ncbi:hypothetical protein L3N51_02311 [Metallosphaera sp. J1]|uniref:hypothetical protein n=1 Tax=Metallosphaera javensis (ex Hofmann et al. 2022) TaxID=99938 RepID=UPI001EDD8CB1|nr:hypothetical protein [Metallosphaera javensis (ex Hofmann et al. 2022)]MCG3110014.1 hypothetical protein [Metallosphaera javensis (ex Hofmann et al. 2022)]
MTLQINRSPFEVNRIDPAKILIKTDNENIELTLYIIPFAIYTTPDYKNISSVVNLIVVPTSDNPRMGEMCNPLKLASHSPAKMEMKVLHDGETEITVNGKVYVIKASLTNVNVYTDLRDQLGNPCVSISWIALTIAK